MEAHVSNTVRGCMYQLRSVQRSLTLDSRRALARAFVVSRIDYCNTVLYGVVKGEVQRLQMVLNAAVRLVVGTGKFSHVTPILRDVLHWLHVQHRISYKITILAWDCIHGIGPAYFGDFCAPVTAAPGPNELTCVQRRLASFWSLEHEQNWANGVSVYPHRQCGTHSRIRSNILLQAENISGEKKWKHTCLGKPTHQPLRTIEEWTYLLTNYGRYRRKRYGDPRHCSCYGMQCIAECYKFVKTL